MLQALDPIQPQAHRGQIRPLLSIWVSTQHPWASFPCSPQGFSPEVLQEPSSLDPQDRGNSPHPQTPLTGGRGARGRFPGEQGGGAAALSWESLASQQG